MDHLRKFGSRHNTSCPFRFTVVTFGRIIPMLGLSIFGIEQTPTFTFRRDGHTAVNKHFVHISRSQSLPLLRIIRSFARGPMYDFTIAAKKRVGVSDTTPTISNPMRVHPTTVSLRMNFVRIPQTGVKEIAPMPTRPFFRFEHVALGPTMGHKIVSVRSTFDRRLLRLAMASTMFTMPTCNPRGSIALGVPTFR